VYVFVFFGRLDIMQKVTDNIFLLVLFAMMGTLILAASFIFFFIRYQRNISKQKEQLQKAELEHGEQLLNATLLSQEDERKRIGRDLHDDVGASLSNLKMMMAQSDDNAAAKHKPLIDNIISTVRNISHSLSPPGLDLFGLEFTLQELFDNFAASGVLQLHFENELGSTLDALDKTTALALFRIIQELLNNTIKHAEAKNITLKFYWENEHVVMSYQDDGKGVPEASIKKSGMGMQNIEARIRMIQAAFEVSSGEGKGFAIKVTLAATPNQL
jgi:signal transduction histidine kinase